MRIITADAAALCQRLDGIPLAIELAASRILALPPAQMLARLRDRDDFLVSRRRDLPERHRTMRAAIDWSYQLLSPELQRFFARLSVFRGGCTLEAAEQDNIRAALEWGMAHAPEAALRLTTALGWFWVTQSR